MNPSILDVLQPDSASLAVAASATQRQRWSTAEQLAWWRERNYRDPCACSALDWSDHIEVVAIVRHSLTWNTPATVPSLLDAASSREAMSALWIGMRPGQRQLHRRCAALLLEVRPSGKRAGR